MKEKTTNINIIRSSSRRARNATRAHSAPRDGMQSRYPALPVRLPPQRADPAAEEVLPRAMRRGQDKAIHVGVRRVHPKAVRPERQQGGGRGGTGGGGGGCARSRRRRRLFRRRLGRRRADHRRGSRISAFVVIVVVAIDGARIAVGGRDEEGFRPRRQHGAEVPHDAPAPAHAAGGLHEAQLR